MTYWYFGIRFKSWPSIRSWTSSWSCSMRLGGISRRAVCAGQQWSEILLYCAALHPLKIAGRYACHQSLSCSEVLCCVVLCCVVWCYVLRCVVAWCGVVWCGVTWRDVTCDVEGVVSLQWIIYMEVLAISWFLHVKYSAINDLSCSPHIFFPLPSLLLCTKFFTLFSLTPLSCTLFASARHIWSYHSSHRSP